MKNPDAMETSGAQRSEEQFRQECEQNLLRIAREAQEWLLTVTENRTSWSVFQELNAASVQSPSDDPLDEEEKALLEESGIDFDMPSAESLFAQMSLMVRSEPDVEAVVQSMAALFGTAEKQSVEDHARTVCEALLQRRIFFGIHQKSDSKNVPGGGKLDIRNGTSNFNLVYISFPENFSREELLHDANQLAFAYMQLETIVLDEIVGANSPSNIPTKYPEAYCGLHRNNSGELMYLTAFPGS